MHFRSFSIAWPGSLLTALLIIALAGCAQRNGDGEAVDTLALDTSAAATDSAEALNSENIYAVLGNDERFSTFVTAVDSAQLDRTLSGPGPFTVFAPTNEAFDQASIELETLLGGENDDELRDLLLNHIINGEKSATSLRGGNVRTLSGGDLLVTGSGDSLRVGTAPFVEEGIDASNGLIHAVGAVLTPSMDDESL